MTQAHHATKDLHDASAAATDLMARIEAQCAKNEWGKVEQLTAEVMSVLQEVPEAQRYEAMSAAKRVLARVQTAALASRGDVSAKLSQIRRGQQAAAAYATAESGDEATVLR